MNDLTLHPGARLTFRRWDSERDTPAWVDSDVTERAAQFLFEEVKLAEGVTLGDLFGLMEAAPLLKAVQYRNFAEALCEEARLGVSPDFVPGYADDGIEFLELYQVWSFDSGVRSYQSLHRWQFHGIGYELRAETEGFEVGARIPWGLSCAALREMLTLPLRVKTDVIVCEDDVNAKAWGNTLDTVKLEHLTLGQLLDGVLWELSFHGAPASAREFAEELQERVDSIDDGSAVLISGDDIFEEFDRPGVAALFETICEHKPAVVRRALSQMEDEANAATGFEAEFGAEVVVKAEFRGLTAYAFRKAFREAKVDGAAAARAST